MATKNRGVPEAARTWEAAIRRSVGWGGVGDVATATCITVRKSNPHDQLGRSVCAGWGINLIPQRCWAPRRVMPSREPISVQE